MAHTVFRGGQASSRSTSDWRSAFPRFRVLWTTRNPTPKQNLPGLPYEPSIITHSSLPGIRPGFQKPR